MTVHRRTPRRTPVGAPLRTVVALALGLVLDLTMTGVTAAADTPDCVSRAEYREVRPGMSKARVHRIFDTGGAFHDGHAGGYTRLYRGCWLAAGVFVSYEDSGTPPHRAFEKSVVPLYFEGDCPAGVCSSRASH